MAKSSDTKTTSTQLENFAEDLGRLLGTAAAKAESWLGQRQQIVQQLTDVRDTAAKLLADLGHHAEAITSSVTGAPRVQPRRATRRKGIIIVGGRSSIKTTPSISLPSIGGIRRTRATAGAVKPARRRGTLSTKGRKAISEAQKARWAKIKATKRKR